jgi:hypothetical protein
VAGSLTGGWWERRRLVKELEHHLEDCVAELEGAGVPEEVAVHDAIARLGDVEAIVAAARATHSTRSLPWRRAKRVSLAWIAVGAMSIVTLAAAELPQASGAKVPGFHVAPAPHVKRHVQSPRTCRCSRDPARACSSS